MKYESLVQKRAIEAAVEQGNEALRRALLFFPPLELDEQSMQHRAEKALQETNKARVALETILNNL